MAKPPTRYWAYVHDVDGELLDDLGDFGTFVEACEEAIAYVRLHVDLKTTVRVIDRELQGGSTVWAIGPVTHKEGQATI